MARIFLSYSSEQHQLAERLVVALRGEGHVVFFDRHNIAVSDSFHRVIRRDIRRSTLMVFLVSPRAVREGSYAVTELNIAQREWKVARFRVVPVVVAPTLLETLPSFLREVSLLEPSGNPVGEVTHAVDHVLRCRRRRLLPLVALCGVVGVLVVALTVVLALGLRGLGEIITSEAPESSPEPEPEPEPEPTVETVEFTGGQELRMIQVEGGQYTMGSPPHEWVGIIDEPQRTVSVNAFWIGETEVTQGQWMALMGSNPSDCDLGCGPQFPVNRVSHDAVLRFANRLSVRRGLTPCYESEGSEWTWSRACNGYRLPTEAEWEYVARAGSTTAFGFGDAENSACTHANARDERRVKVTGRPGANVVHCDDGYAALAPVGEFEPNAFGVFDTHGNVWEWVWEASPESAIRRLIRGGSYLDGAASLRVSNRSHNHAKHGRGSIGFRLARSG